MSRCNIVVLMIIAILMFIILASCSDEENQDSSVQDELPEDDSVITRNLDEYELGEVTVEIETTPDEKFTGYMRDLESSWKQIMLQIYDQDKVIETVDLFKNMQMTILELELLSSSKFAERSLYPDFSDQYNHFIESLTELVRKYSSTKDEWIEKELENQENPDLVETWDRYFQEHEDPFRTEIENVIMSCAGCHENIRTFPVRINIPEEEVAATEVIDAPDIVE